MYQELFKNQDNYNQRQGIFVWNKNKQGYQVVCLHINHENWDDTFCLGSQHIKKGSQHIKKSEIFFSEQAPFPKIQAFQPDKGAMVVGPWFKNVGSTANGL